MPVNLPPIEAARLVPILANPRAGSGKSHRVVRELVEALKTRGVEPALCSQREALSELASARHNDIRCVVSAGGDGTLLEVLNRAPGHPVAILPLGNENLVARFCGMERSAQRVAHAVIDGELRTTDLARANGRLFSIMAGVGFDADVVHRVHEGRSGHINKLNWVVPIFESLSRYRYPEIEIDIEDTGEKLHGCMLFVVNLPRYALDLPIARDAVPDDGKLDLCLFPRPGRLNLARYLTAVLRGRHKGLPDFQKRLVKRLRLSSANSVPVQTDGDPAGFLPLTIEVVPKAMTLVTPGAMPQK
jgi:diacylglycerol kinase family enzyme